ncbi:MAG: LLM class flavin-dependent oxidoreductase [Phenylobacterium sp.]
MSAVGRQMKLGLSMRGLGYHASAWSHPDVTAEGSMSFEFYRNVTQIAERGLFDMVFLADYLGMARRDKPRGLFGRSDMQVSLEPLTLLSALAATSRNIGLVCTTSTSFQEPFHIARMFASLDHISGGRAAWNVVTSFQNYEARNFSLDSILPKDLRYERAREAVQVVSGLWDSWQDDAFVRDKASGVFFDPARMQPLDHVGKYFKVAGPLNMPRTPQGRPIIVQAGASDLGQELAAETADVVYAAHATLASAQAYYRGVKSRMAKFGRHEDEVKIMPGLLPVIGETEAEAQAKYRALQEAIDPIVGLSVLTGLYGDLSDVDIDAPVPAKPLNVTMSRGAVMHETALRNGFTIRQLYQSVAIGNGHNVVVGTPKMVADVMEEWFVERGADGFNVLPAISPTSAEEFVDLVVPELQRRGLFRTAYEGPTMRENLGLAWPEVTARVRAAE